MKYKDYKVLSMVTDAGLEYLINKHLKKGYTLVGGISVQTVGDYQITTYYQAVAKIVED